MKKIFKFCCVMILALSTVLYSGCQKIQQVEIKLGWKNLDFEYMKNNKVDKIIIQSTRDEGFRFTVTDKQTISDLYDILSTAKEVAHKTELQPDYTFEIHEGNVVHKFSYITGIDKKDNYGNLYDDNKVFLVSQRIDNDIIRNLWDLREPIDFYDSYYGGILAFLEKYESNISKKSNNIAIDISQDTEIAKYLFSMDLEDFKEDLKKKAPGIQLVTNSDDRDKYNTLIVVKTYGYKKYVYKAIVSVNDKEEKSETKYYINNKYENNEWDISVTDKKPNQF